MKNHAFDGVHMGATWRIRLNDLCSAAMRAVAAITLATCRLLDVQHYTQMAGFPSL